MKNLPKASIHSKRQNINDDINGDGVNRVVVVMPALNESRTIYGLIKKVQKKIPVILVDDGSSDGTSKKAKLANAIVVRHQISRGYDAALSSGLNQALEMGFTHAITMDADGQHNPVYIDSFIELIENGSDLIIGKRDYFQRKSELLFAWYGKRFWKISDPLCGMKAYRLSLVNEYGAFNRWRSAGTEFAVRLIKAGVVPTEIPIIIRPRADESRFGGVFKANLKIFLILLRLLLQK